MQTGQWQDNDGGADALGVLVVENHADTRLSVRIFLESLGHRVNEAENIAGALAVAGQGDFDVLLSDISLPDGDGWELLTQLHTRGCCPRWAIAMSGLGSATDHARSREAGFALHLVKPFTSGELRSVIQRVEAEEAPVAGLSAAPPAPGLGFNERMAQRIHDSLCQDLAAAALWQGTLLRRLEKTPLEAAAAEARQVSQLLDHALDETRALMRLLREG